MCYRDNTGSIALSVRAQLYDFQPRKAKDLVRASPPRTENTTAIAITPNLFQVCT